MREPRLYGALHDAHRQVDQEQAVQDEARALSPQQASGHFYGELREQEEPAVTGAKPARTDEPEPEAAHYPIRRGWPMKQSMAIQQPAANIWARQNNEALSELGALREAARDSREQEHEALERNARGRDDPDLEM